MNRISLATMVSSLLPFLDLILQGKGELYEKTILRIIKVVVCTVLTVAVSLTGVGIADVAKQKMGIIIVAQAVTVTNKIPLVTYIRYSGNLTTYMTSALMK